MNPTALSPSPSAVDRIELRLLRYFLAVLEEGHFGRAAARLHMSQPPLSRAVRKLEAQVDVVLLKRGSSGVAPTEAGLAFAREARKVLTGVDLAVAEARRAGGTGSPLRIGCAAHVPMEPLHRLVTALQERRLVSQADVARLSSAEQLRRLHAGRLDLGIFPYPGGQTSIETEPFLPEEPLAAFLAPDHELATKEVVGPADLQGETLLVYQSAYPALWERCRERLQEAGYGLDDVRDVTGSTDGRDGLLAASSGRGVALLPASILETTQAEPIVVRRPLNPPVSMPHVVVGWGARPPPQLARVLAAVREIIQEIRDPQATSH